MFVDIHLQLLSPDELLSDSQLIDLVHVMEKLWGESESILSRFEEWDDIPTSFINHCFLPGYLGICFSRSFQKRKTSLEISNQYIDFFVALMDRLGIRADGVDVSDIRARKIWQHHAKKSLEKKLAWLIGMYKQNIDVDEMVRDHEDKYREHLKIHLEYILLQTEQTKTMNCSELALLSNKYDELSMPRKFDPFVLVSSQAKQRHDHGLGLPTVMIDDLEDEDSSLRKAREWDEFKDQYRRGCGNRINQG